MDIKLQKKLYDEYPLLFKQKDFSIRESCMPFGIEVSGEGWYKLLDVLCDQIQGTIDCNNLPYQCEFTQIKEKHGTAKIYHAWKITDQEKYKEDSSERMMNMIDGMIDFAEAMSGKICEVCGEWGENKSVNGWWSTRCPKCRRKQLKMDLIRKIKWWWISFTSLPRKILIKLRLIDCPNCVSRFKYNIEPSKTGCSICGRTHEEILKLKEEIK